MRKITFISIEILVGIAIILSASFFLKHDNWEIACSYRDWDQMYVKWKIYLQNNWFGV